MAKLNVAPFVLSNQIPNNGGLCEQIIYFLQISSHTCFKSFGRTKESCCLEHVCKEKRNKDVLSLHIYLPI